MPEKQTEIVDAQVGEIYLAEIHDSWFWPDKDCRHCWKPSDQAAIPRNYHQVKDQKTGMTIGIMVPAHQECLLLPENGIVDTIRQLASAL